MKLVQLFVFSLCLIFSMNSSSTIICFNDDLIFKNTFETWILNNDGEVAVVITDDSGNDVLVNVESVNEVTVSGIDYISVTASGVPNYCVEADQDLIDALNSRPRAGTDFLSGQTTMNVGDIVEFGDDIGYDSNTNQCNISGGLGYWPPGPDCPEDTAKIGLFPVDPEPSTEVDGCEIGLGVLGYFVNGVSVFHWGDGQSYVGGGPGSTALWYNLAAKAEVYDLDVCDGHAANGEYHHHFYSQCLADTVGDQANGHSPIYGFAADGYAIHGPWHDAGVLSKSPWVARDYDDPSDPYGCGGTGERTCVMVDEFDPAMGTTAASSNGPDTDDTVVSMSGNTLSTETGFYYEDYYYDSSLTASGDDYLDQHGGHDHDGYGYHYHLPTEFNDQGEVVTSFPSTIGPTFYGELTDDAITSCADSGGGPPGGGGGGPIPN